jgi:hypothetical protein
MYYLTPNDFQGKFALHTGMYTNATIQDYIDRYEPLYLMQLFGAKMYDEFVSDMGIFNIPISPNYEFLFNPFHENYAFNRLVVSNGIVDMLKGFVYFEYCKDLTNQMTINGNVRPTGENSGDVSTLYSMMFARYNESVRTFRAIQTHIVNNFNAPTGQITVGLLTNQGTGYVEASNLPLIGGSGTGATAEVVQATGGIIDTIFITDKGLNYQVGDVLTITGGNNDAIITVDKIGIGNYNNFAGVNKQFSYWI